MENQRFWKRRAVARVAVAFVSTFCLKVVAVCAAGPSDALKLLNEMDAANAKVSNIEIHFDMREQEPSQGSGWVDNGLRDTGTAWFDGKVGSKGRISFDLRTLRWNPGVPGEKFAQDVTEAGFDGKEGRYIEHAVINAGVPVSINEGRITPDPDVMVFGEFQAFISTGRMFATMSAQEGAISLPAFLRDFANAPDGFTESREKLGDVDAVKFSCANRFTHENYWFDEARGMALLGKDAYDGTILADRIRVTKLIEAAPGIWYPGDATFEHQNPLGTVREFGDPPYVRYVYHASQVVANRADFDASIFQLQFPPGCRVTDHVRGISYQVAP